MDSLAGGGGVVALALAVWKHREVWAFVKAGARVPFILEGVAKEFSPNGGGSLKDQMNRIEAKLESHLDHHGGA